MLRDLLPMLSRTSYVVELFPEIFDSIPNDIEYFYSSYLEFIVSVTLVS